MKQRAYLWLAVAGTVIPYYFFVSFLIAHGLDAKLFAQQLVGTPISAFFAADLVLSAVVFVCFLESESARLSIPRSKLFLIPLLTIGLSCALPLFLYIRESWRSRT
jgi:uncharacterized protein DUF2834